MERARVGVELRGFGQAHAARLQQVSDLFVRKRFDGALLLAGIGRRRLAGRSRRRRHDGEHRKECHANHDRLLRLEARSCARDRYLDMITIISPPWDTSLEPRRFTHYSAALKIGVAW